MRDGMDGVGTDESEVDLSKLLAEDSDEGVVEDEERAAVLRARCATLLEEHTFQPGQLVKWKKGMRNRLRPAYGEPVIVIEVMDPPIYEAGEEKSGGSAYFHEPLSLIAGTFLKKGGFLCFHYDHRRFEPYAGAGVNQQ